MNLNLFFFFSNKKMDDRGNIYPLKTAQEGPKQ
jgi:hypothetical protein